MFTVSLSGVQFFASIGMYSEEMILKNKIEMDVSVSQEANIHQLPLFDYEKIYQILKKAVQTPAVLLEDLMIRIVAALELLYPNTIIKIAIKKLNPPLPGIVNNSCVSWQNS